MAPCRIVVLISGSGSNLQALIDAQDTPALPDTQITLVLSNRKAAYGLQRAQNANPPIPTDYLALQPYLKAHPGATRTDYDAEVARIVLAAQPDLVILAGWMHVLGDTFLEPLSAAKAPRGWSPVPVINLHPAMPGQFDGAHAIERQYAAFQEGKIPHGGAMVHRVIRDVDRGTPLLVREVPMKKDEPIEAFERRLHEMEWKIIVEGAAKALLEVHSLHSHTCLFAHDDS
ncbi:phosphoribosylglycinamide formyltransferase [Fistulina hepatica ATCC 64428]|uniref:Phosphoribosylglycinamide formyltransferase n=1 Tax=Fistulina hepatica ATCC 64428 TaxID=1128425 RepID=A0A0D7APS5_9AGAR|nr:phosphoribosylglycinamide formyltransferase [Fistulina hepatica ATCC 64428]